MEIEEIQKEALRIRNLYSQLEKKNFGREWNHKDIFTGLVSDVGDLGRLVLAHDGVMKIENLDKKVEHEISDCLWAILVLADKYNVKIESAFLKNIKELEDQIKSKLEEK